jgi:GntR family transcriptional repressor for pyruvate dehydrogenase complex
MAMARISAQARVNTMLDQDHRSLTERVAETLRRHIETQNLRPGAKLPSEAELVASYGVSRTVVREAISQLRAGAVVETHRGIGTFVRDPATTTTAFPATNVDRGTLAEVLALLELRISLETEAASLAAKRRTDVDVQRLEELVEAIAAMAETGGDAADADFEFHLAVASASGNHFFTDLLRHLGRAIIPRTRIDSPGIAHQARADYLRQVNHEHRAVFRAIARQDADAARAAMRTHLANSRERLRSVRGDTDDI